MTRLNIAELRNQLSKHLRAVENGAEVIVTDRDRPIARIVPYEAVGKQINIIPATRQFTSIRSRRYPPSRWQISSTDLLLEERKRR